MQKTEQAPYIFTFFFFPPEGIITTTIIVVIIVIYWGGRNWEKGLIAVLHKIDYMARNFYCWDVPQVFLTTKTVADAQETLFSSHS